MNTDYEPREERLPKWAQDKLISLRSKLASAVRRIDASAAAQTVTRIAVAPDAMANGAPTLFAPSNKCIRFLLGQELPVSDTSQWTYRHCIDVRIEQSSGKFSLEVIAGDRIFVSPRASNSITISMVHDK